MNNWENLNRGGENYKSEMPLRPPLNNIGNIGLSLTSVQLEVVNENDTLETPIHNLHNSTNNSSSNKGGQVRGIMYTIIHTYR